MGRIEMVTPGTPNANPAQPREAYGFEDPGYPGNAAQVQAPQNGTVQGQSAAANAPNQAQRVFSSELVSPTNTDLVLYTVPKIATTLAAAVSAGPQTVAVASAANIIPGMLLAIADAANPESVWVTAVNQPGNTISGVFRFAHASGLAVTCSRTFFITDVVITTSATASQTPTRVKARTTITSGAITTGSHAVTFANPANSAQVGDIIFVGGTVYMDDPSSGTYEAVVVTAITRNSAGIITGFTATFGQAHAANVVMAFPVYVNYVNATKGIEAIGIETQTSVPAGMSLAVHFGAVTGEMMINIGGFEQ